MCKQEIDLHILPVPSLSDSLHQSKNLFLDTLESIASKMRQLRSGGELLFSKVEFSGNHMSENFTYT